MATAKWPILARMTDNSDFFSDAPRMPLGRGGARPGSGPKPKVPPAPTPDEASKEPSAYQKYEIARAEKELHLARQAAVKADLDESRVVYIEAVADATAQAFAACSQSLDAIADMLEREGVPVEVTQRVAEIVNQAKTQLAADLEAMHRNDE